MRRMQIAFLVLVSLFVAGASLGQEPVRLALVIGNKSYTQKVGPLKNPHHDVALVAAALAKLGFKVTTLRDADYRTMDSAIKRYVAEIRGAGKGALSFFYYSGHGVANPDTQVNYLIPVDVADANDANIWYQSFEQSTIIDRLSQQAPNATHYVIFDACRNELNLTGPAAKALGAEKGFVPVSHASGLLIAYATAPKQTASDIGDRGGTYATILAEEMVKPNVEAVTMFRNVQIRVKEAIGQDPWLSFPSVPPVYFAGELPRAVAPKASTLPTASPELVREAVDAWAAVKDTNNIALLEAYITRYKDTFYAELARARIADLKKQVAVAAPPSGAKAVPPPKVTTGPPATPNKSPDKQQIRLWRDSAQPAAFKMQSVGSVGCCWSGPFAKTLASLSGDKLKIEVFAAGSVVPFAEQLDAVSTGKLVMGWGVPSYWSAKSLALHIYGGSIPFGHEQAQFIRWVRDRGEAELNGLYQNHLKLKVRAIACGTEGPEGMWFKKPINSIDDLKRLRIRTAGFPYDVMQKLGLNVQFLRTPQEIIAALERGTVDGAEFSQPWVDDESGFPRLASNYYYPGWHAPTALWQLEINLDKWNELTEAQRGLIAEACRQNVDHTIDEYKGLADAALARIRAKGVQVRTFPTEILGAVRTARDEVVREFSAKNPEFKRAWESYISSR
jgi:TRAP-type mannitol/chloroaromatic compound transport system substrate-binding protein